MILIGHADRFLPPYLTKAIDDRTGQIMVGRTVIGRVRIPSDPVLPVGTTTVTFQGLFAGSEIRVYSPAGEVAGIESCDANHVLTWPVYPAGSPNNTVQIKIINFVYRIIDFPYASVVGNQTIPVQMEADRWAYNP